MTIVWSVEMLRIGKGKHRALLVGGPHPNEPIGIMSLEYLSQILCENTNLLENLDYTIYIIKVIDIDGYRLNQDWLKAPYTADRYIKGYFRPSAVESNIKIFDQIFKHQEQLMQSTDHNYLRPATVAELFDKETRYQWILLNTVSMFIRMTKTQQPNPELQEIQIKIKNWFEDYLANLLNKLNYKVQPLRNLSAI